LDGTILWTMAVYPIVVVLLIAAVIGMSSVLEPRHSDRATGEPFESGILPAGSAHLHISARFPLIATGFQAKYPGPKMLLWPVEMRFTYRDSFEVSLPDAYETLLRDVMNNDATLFMRAAQVAAAWRLLMPVLEACAESNPHFPNYTAGC
jgi:hypothetical protein